MKAVRDAAILLILIVLVLTVRISPIDSGELAPTNHASLAEVARPTADEEPAQTPEALPVSESERCPGRDAEQIQMFVLEIDEAIESLSEAAPQVVLESLIRRADLDCT